MPKVSNKLESDDFIISSGMNYSPFVVVRSFLEVLGKKWDTVGPYSIRYKGRGMQPFVPNLSELEVVDFCQRHFSSGDRTPLGIYAATEYYDKYRMSNAEVRINPDMTIDGRFCRGNMKMRDALSSERAVDFVGKPLNYKPVGWAIDYLLKYDVIGCVVELTLFSRKVGIRQHDVLVWEVRNF